MIKSEIVYEDILNAVKMWATRTDGFDGAIGGIYEEIPWSNELQEKLPWDSVEDKFSDVIPMCPNIDTGKIVCGDFKEIEKLNVMSFEVAKKVIGVYNSIIDNLNKELTKNFATILNDKTSFKIYGKTKYDVIRKIWNTYLLGFTMWNFEEFVDAMYSGKACFIGKEKFATLNLP